MPLDPFAYPASPLDQEDAPVARTPLVRAHEQPEEAAPTAKPDLKKLVAFAGDRFGVDPNVLAGMIMKESSLNDDVISGKRKSTAGAVGIAQFMPETAARYGVDPTDPVQSVMGMAAYMRDNLAKFNGDYRKAIAGYNWGENRKALDGHDWEDHAPAETKDYVDFVTKFATSLGSKPQAPSEQRSLPAGVSPSAETGGRGLINPALADPNAPAPTNAPSMASEIGLGTVDSFGIGSGNTVRNAGRFLQAPAADLKSSRDNLLAAAGVVGSHMSADDPDSALMGMPASGDTLVSQESVQALRDKARASADAAELQRQQNLHDGTFHGVAGKMLEEAGQGAQQHYQAELAQDAPRMLAASNEINNANGFVDTVKKSVMGDGLLGTLGTVAQSAPDTLIGMAVGSLAGKVTSAVLEKTAARAGQQAFEEVWAKARNTAASSAETAAAANAARAETYHGVLQEGAERVAGNVGNYVEGSQSGGSTGSQISDMVQQKKDDGTYAISNDDLLKNSPRFVALVNSGKPADQARTLLAAELSDEASPIAALWTRAAGKLSGAAEAEGKVLAGGHISAKTLVQNIGKEALEEGMQNPGENYAQYDSQRQVDPTQKFDLGGSIAQGVIGGIAQAGPMHGAGYLQSRLHPTAAATSFTESDSDSAKAGLTPIVVPNMPNAAPAVKAQEEDIHAGVSDALAALSGGSGAGLRGVDSGRVGNDGLSADGTAGVQPVSASPAEAGGSGGAVSEDGAASPAAPAVVGAGEDTGAAASLDNHNAIDGAEAAAPAQDKPETTWKGRSGTGFATEADAQQAVPGRALRAPTLDHRVEADGNGRYAINGYARSAVDIAAHAAATSPSNSLAVPTEAQKEAGNYQKGHLSIQGLNIAIENPKGSQRTGVDKGGKAWSTTMQSHYGYIKGTVGNDKDHVDTFIGPHTDSSKVFIVDQIHPSDGTFDEHKVVLGATSVDQARGIYDSNYDKGWKGAAGITEMPMPQFKIWVKDGVKSKPLSDLSGLPTRETNDANLTFPDITGSGVAEGSRADQGDARGRDVTDSMEFPTISDGPGAVGGATEDGRAGADLPSVLKRQAPSAPASTASMKYEQLGEHVGAAVTPFTGPRNDGQQLAGAIARVFGKTLDFYSVAPGAKGKPSAFIYDKKHVFIDATAGDGPVQLVMHEAMHGLGKERVAGLVEKLKPLMQNVDEFRDKLGYNDTNKHEELAAFFTQAQAQKPEFWKQVRDALGEGDFRTLAQAVLDKIDQLKAAFDKNLGDKFMARYATDVEAVRKIIVAEFAASASDKSQTSLQGDTQFSKATDVERSSRDLVEDPASFKQAAGLKPGTNGVREIGEALQKRTADTHGVIADTDTSTKARDQIAGAIADEVEHQLLGNSRANKSGVGWYSHNYPKALKALGKLYPELQKSKGARATFTAFLAVTSNGEKVGRNIAMARQLYETHRSGGDITKAIPGTKRQDVLDKNVHEISRLIALHGENGLPKFLLEEMKVGDINAALRAEGEKPSSSYPTNMVMPRAALYFGPKLGAFYANLMGSSGYLTMDLWWSRSFNRMRGTLVPEVSEVTLKNMREKFGEPEATQEELVALAKPYEESYAKKNYKDGTSLETASNSFIKKAVYELNEAPARASDRQFMVDTAVKAQELLKAKGVDITLADMQAALWYYEKRLYGALGSKVVGDIGYQEALENAARETQPTGDAGSVGSDTRGAGKEDRAGARSDVPVESKSTQFSHGTSEAGGLQDDRGVRGGSRVLAESDRQAARDSGREDDGSLKGLPRKVGDFIASVFPTATKVAQDYAASRGMQYTPPSQYKKVDAARAARIATAFTEMKSDPQNPEVRAAYSAMIDETLAQYAAILKTGLKVEFIDFKTQGDPYLGNPRQMTADVRDNNHMWVFSTRDGFGTDAEFDVSANPLLAETAHQISGQAAMANDIFRVVHDYFGHVKEGVGFRADGEENAWRAHSAMYSPLARRAMTTETRGQNSWVNYGPHGEANRTAASADTIYADQKIGLMPEWVSEDAKGDTQFSNATKADVSPIGFYSALARSIANGPGKAMPEQWQAYIRGLTTKGVKADEIQWSGVEDWLKLQDGKVSKEAVSEYLKNNGVQVTETTLGQPSEDEIQTLLDDEAGEGMSREDAIDYLSQDEGSLAPKYSTYTLPGGTNYREVLLTLPSNEQGEMRKQWVVYDANNDISAVMPNEPSAARIEQIEQRGERLETRMVAAKQKNESKGLYQSSHWDAPNVLAHIRLNDRIDADGKKVLFVEELQSDWGQEGKKKGFAIPSTNTGKFRVLNRDGSLFNRESTEENAKRWAAEIGGTYKEDIISGIPAAPFVGKTDAWLSLGLKRVVKLAVDGGYDKVAFVNGEQSAARYDLSKQIGEVQYHDASAGGVGSANLNADESHGDLAAYDLDGKKILDRHMSHTEIEDHIGKDLSRKLLESKPTQQRGAGGNMVRSRGIQGLDLKVGGEGMKTFYDKIVPNAVKDVVRKLGGEGPTETSVLARDPYETAKEARAASGLSANKWTNLTGEQRLKHIEDYAATLPQEKQVSFVITDKMKAQAGEGLPMFSNNTSGLDEKNDYAFDLNSIKPGAQKPAAPVTKATDGWILSRDELGHFRFGAGAKLYRAVASIAQTVSAKVGMAPMSKELSRAVRVMKQESANAMELTAKVATAMNKMPESERQMISDIIEGELQAGVTPAKHVLDIAANISALMSKQTDELIEVGMLSAEAAEKWRDKYLPRFYESKLGDKVQDAWTKAVNRMSGKPRALQGIGGKSLKRRGLVEVIATKELKKYTDMGWVIDDPKFNAATDETVSVHRDFTRVEREKMGEIRDAMFRFVMGYTRSQKDLALGRLYEHLSETMASRHELPGYVRVPDSQIDGTDVSTYGKLAGLYVPQEVLSHLSQYGESEHEALLKMYRKGMGMWKEGKTVLNPVSHANNVASNLTMAHFAGVSYWDAHKYAGAIKDFFTNGGLMKEAKAAGLFGGTISESELMNLLPKEMQVMAQMTQSNSAKAVEHVWNTMSLFLRKPMGAAYQAEDLFFRYMIYKHARDQGLHDNDAVDYAQKFIFTYDDLPKGARVLRDVALPFFSYTYKVIPVMAETVLAYPWRYAAPMAVLHAVNSIAYAIAHGHDDDDDWKESIKKFVHGVHVGSLPNAGTAADRAFYDGAIQKEAMERKNLPPWMKGNGIALGTPKTIRLGMDHLTQLPVFLDVSRMFPGGDLLDMSSNTGGIPWLQNLTPSHPLLSTMTAMMFNRDPYFGKDVVDSNDTTKEAAIKRGQWLWTQVAPAIAISNYHWNRAGNAIAQATGHNIPWWPDDYTGFGKDGLPTQPKYAAMQTFGLKARPIDLDTAAQIDASQKKKMIADLETEMRGIRRLRGKQAISNEQAESKLDLDRLKVQRLRQGLDVNGNEKDD